MAEPHVMSALKAKRAELAGEIQVAEKRIAQLRADLLHVDAVLRLFDPAAQPDAIPARRPYRRRNWFSDGELPRRILDTLRGSETPLSANEIAGRVMAQKGLDAGDTGTLLLIRKFEEALERFVQTDEKELPERKKLKPRKRAAGRSPPSEAPDRKERQSKRSG